MTIVAGSAVGVLGLEGWSGFFVYLLSQLLVSDTGEAPLSAAATTAATACPCMWHSRLCMSCEEAGSSAGTMNRPSLRLRDKWRLLLCCSCMQCSLPVLAKCGGNYEKYLGTW